MSPSDHNLTYDTKNKELYDCEAKSDLQEWEEISAADIRTSITGVAV